MKKHIILLFTAIAVLVLLPNEALAAIEASKDTTHQVIVFVIKIAKFILLLAGVLLILRAVIKSSNGQPVGSALGGAIVVIIIPAVLVSLYDHSISQRSFGGVGNAGGSLIGGRPMVEYMMAQVGLNAGGVVAQWAAANMLYIATLYIGGAISVYYAYTMDHWVIFRKWAILAALIFVVFNPIIMVDAPPITLHEIRAKITAGQGMVVNNSNNFEDGIPYIHSNDLAHAGESQLPFLNNSKIKNNRIEVGDTSKIKNAGYRVSSPLVLTYINAAMDHLVKSLVALFGDKSFSAFGISFTKALAQRLTAHITNPNTRNRVKFFIRNCYLPALQKAGKDGEPLDNKIDNAGIRDLTNPFSKRMMMLYTNDITNTATSGISSKKSDLRLCSDIVNDKYVLFGKKAEFGLKEEIAIDFFINSNGKTKAEAQTTYESLARKDKTKMLTDVINNVFGKEMSGVAIEDANSYVSNNSADHKLGRGTFLGGLLTAGKEAIGAIGLAATAATRAVEATVVNKTMPLYMGFAQMVLLALFPLIWMFSLLPGAGGLLLQFFVLLFWAKSYVIAWALISNFAKWMEYTTFMKGTTEMTTSMAYSEAISQMQIWSPILMYMIIMGGYGVAQNISSGVGRGGSQAAAQGGGAATAAL